MPTFAGMKIIVSKEIEQVCPTFVGACVEAKVVNTPFCEALWKEIDALCEHYRATLTTETLKEMSSIAATRSVYKACGKDPSRYRPASEALIRRVLQGKSLYQIDTLVDLINLASIAYGYSIGGFDADKFKGDTLTLGIGKEGEPYEGIGRGILPAITSAPRWNSKPPTSWCSSMATMATNPESSKTPNISNPSSASIAKATEGNMKYIAPSKK